MSRAKEVLVELIKRAVQYRMFRDPGAIAPTSSEYARKMASKKVGEVVLESALSPADREALKTLNERDVQEVKPLVDVDPVSWYSTKKRSSRKRVPFSRT